MKHKRFILFGILFLVLVVPSIPASSANFSADTNINDAWYADLDGDGSEDDVAVNVTLTLSNNKIFTDVDLYINLVLPSGKEFWFVSYLTIEKYTRTAAFILLYELMDTATEPGWYDVYTVAFAEGETLSRVDYFTFDPPGGGDGVTTA